MNSDFDQFSEEKNSTGLPAMLFVVLAVFLLIPFAGMYLFADTLNPFELTGKPFLAFYGMLSCIAYGTAYALRVTGLERLLAAAPRHLDSSAALTAFNVARWVVRATIFLGIARLVRGIYLGRPVIFLCLMMLAHAIIYSMFFKNRIAGD